MIVQNCTRFAGGNTREPLLRATRGGAREMNGLDNLGLAEDGGGTMEGMVTLDGRYV